MRHLDVGAQADAVAPDSHCELTVPLSGELSTSASRPDPADLEPVRHDGFDLCLLAEGRAAHQHGGVPATRRRIGVGLSSKA
jgi:hypothetical protein